MNIISIIENFSNTFNANMNANINPLNLEQEIVNVGDQFTLKLYEKYLNYIDTAFKLSPERIEQYIVKETTTRTLASSVGYISFNSTRYIDRNTGKSYSPIRDFLSLRPNQRMTNEAEYAIIKCVKENNMSQAAKFALRNIQISRSTVSKKILKLKGSIKENIVRVKEQAEVLYIEIDEIHTNLQHRGNKICPCAIVHEGYLEDFTKRKVLKNIHYFASVELNYNELTEVIYDYVDKRYDIDKFKVIFVSGDGLIATKKLHDIFPNSVFVLDPFHYRLKHLRYIFKENKKLTNLADYYIKNNKINEFNELVKYQMEKYLDQVIKIKEHDNCIIKNIKYIQNQDHELYKCPCSMEGHVNHAFARYITSSPYGFSQTGLNNKLKLLVYKANKVNLTIEDYMELRYGRDSYKEINKKINELLIVKIDRKIFKEENIETKINIQIPILSSGDSTYQSIKDLISINNNINYI